MTSLETEISESDVESLKRRFQLVEGDRKAYFETYEVTKSRNDENIRELRAANQELRKTIAKKKREESKPGSGGRGGNAEVESEIKQLHRLRTTYDKMRHKTATMSETLQKMEDNLAELEAQSAEVNDAPQRRKIRMLENRLDKAMIKYNEAQSIRKTYAQIVKRLEDERVGFDNQLSAIERTLKAKRSDYQELLLLAGEARHAKETAMTKLERARKTYAESCHQRALELKDREFVVRQRKHLQDRIAERKREKESIVADAASKLGLEDDEERLKKALLESNMEKTQTMRETQEIRASIKSFEDAFRRIKDTTNIASIKEVLRKMTTQETSTANLKKVSDQNQSKIDALKQEIARVAARVDDLKYSGNSSRAGARKIVDDLETQLISITSECEAAKAKYERVQRILIDSQSGVEHLHNKIGHIEVSGTRDVVPGGNVLDLLYNCETILSELNRRVGEAGNDAERRNMKELTDVTSAIDDDDIAASRPFNRRINLDSETKDTVAFDEKIEVAEEIDENVQREQMKAAALERAMRHDSAAEKVESKTTQVEEQALLRKKTKRSGGAGGAKPGSRAGIA